MNAIKTFPRGLVIFAVLLFCFFGLIALLLKGVSGSYSSQSFSFSSDSRADTITVTNDFHPDVAVIYLKGELREPVRIYCRANVGMEEQPQGSDMIIPLLLREGKVDTMARMDYYGREFNVICVPVSDTPRYGKKLQLDVSIHGIQ